MDWLCILTPLNKVQRMLLSVLVEPFEPPRMKLNAVLNLPSLDFAGMERAKPAAIRVSGHAKIVQHDNRFQSKRIYANPMSTVTHPLRP